ncbi:MAG: acyloxyacyl hydrolase [Bacteroidota bacterium]
MMKSIICVLLMLSSLCLPSLQAQGQDGWPGIPPIRVGDPLVLINQTSFLVVMGAAATSYAITKWAGDNQTLNFALVRGGYFGAMFHTSIVMENIGLEKRLAPWFGIGLELNNQQWIAPNYSGAGMGLNSYYRWYVLGSRRFSPYMEHGAGVFYGFSKFPEGGTNFTFNLTSAFGVEYTFDNQYKIRTSYGHIHHSNNNLLDVNPGIDGNGVNVTFLWSLD